MKPVRVEGGVEDAAGGRHQLSRLPALLEGDAGGEVGEVGHPAAGELGHHVVPGQGEEGGGALVGLGALHLVQGEGGGGEGGQAPVDGGLEGREEEEGEELEAPGKEERGEIEDEEEATLSDGAHVAHRRGQGHTEAKGEKHLAALLRKERRR